MGNENSYFLKASFFLKLYMLLLILFALSISNLPIIFFTVPITCTTIVVLCTCFECMLCILTVLLNSFVDLLCFYWNGKITTKSICSFLENEKFAKKGSTLCSILKFLSLWKANGPLFTIFHYFKCSNIIWFMFNITY